MRFKSPLTAAGEFKTIATARCAIRGKLFLKNTLEHSNRAKVISRLRKLTEDRSEIVGTLLAARSGVNRKLKVLRETIAVLRGRVYAENGLNPGTADELSKTVEEYQSFGKRLAELNQSLRVLGKTADLGDQNDEGSS